MNKSLLQFCAPFDSKFHYALGSQRNSILSFANRNVQVRQFNFQPSINRSCITVFQKPSITCICSAMLIYVFLFAVEHQTEDGVPEEGRETDDEIGVACAR